MQNNIICVNNVQGYLDNNGTAWLNAEDVAIGFGFSQSKNGVEYVKWERVNSYLRSFGYSPQVGKGDYIPENMVYRLGFKANNDTAARFQSVLADDILPTIRKTGGYIAANAEMSDEEIMSRALEIAHRTIERKNAELKELESKNAEQRQIIADKDTAIAEQSKVIEERGEQIAELSRDILEMKPKVSYYDMILNNKSTVAVTQIAQDYGMSAKAFNKTLYSLHIQHKVNGQWILYSEHLPMGYVQSKSIDIKRKDGTTFEKLNTEWTQKGRLFLYDKLKSNGIIPVIERN